MIFLQKNKSVLIILLMAGFLVVILSIFFSGISESDSSPTPTGIVSQQLNFATSTGNAPSASLSDGTPMPDAPSGTLNPPSGVTVQPATESSPHSLASPSPTVKSSTAEALPVTNTPLPPTGNDLGEGPPSTIFPPPLTFVPLPTETPPPGNGPPPGS